MRPSKVFLFPFISKDLYTERKNNNRISSRFSWGKTKIKNNIYIYKRGKVPKTYKDFIFPSFHKKSASSTEKHYKSLWKTGKNHSLNHQNKNGQCAEKTNEFIWRKPKKTLKNCSNTEITHKKDHLVVMEKQKRGISFIET